MKRSWIGFALLMAMLLGGILVTRKMGRIHDPIGKQLQQAAQCAMDNNWEQAEFLFQQAESSWKKTAHFRGCFADHNPVEEVDAAFAMLQVTCASRDPVAFAGGCRSLARQVAAVGEAHRLVWWNLL